MPAPFPVRCAQPPRAGGLATVVAASVVLVGCGMVGAESARQDRDYIAPAEVAEAITAENAYLLVQRLRPLWLHERGPKSVHFDPGVVVYTNEMVFGNAESLRLIPVMEVHAIRYLSPAKANLIHGAGHPHGAIVVVVKSDP